MLKDMTKDTKKRIKTALILLGAGAAVNIGLAILKTYIGIGTNSLTIMLDGMNNTFDVLTQVVSIIAFATLFVPKNEKAPFGYGRSEYLAAFIVAVVSAVVGGYFFIRSLNRLAIYEPVWFGVTSCALVGVSVFIKLGLGLLYMFFNRKLKSKAISAIMLDCFLDSAMTTASLISYAVSGTVYAMVDAYIGMAMSIVVVGFAVAMIADNVKCIVRGSGGEEDKEKLRAIFDGEPKITDVTELTIHDYGFEAKAADAKVKYAEGVTLKEAAEICDELSKKAGEMCGIKLIIQPAPENAGETPESEKGDNLSAESINGEIE